MLERSLGALEHARALIDHGLALGPAPRAQLAAGQALALRCGATARRRAGRGARGSGTGGRPGG